MFYAEPLSDVVAAVVTTIVFVTVVPGLLRKEGAPRQTHRKIKGTPVRNADCQCGAAYFALISNIIK